MNLPLDATLAFFATSIAIELTPGPNMAYLALLSAQRGRAAGAAAVVGVALGLAIIGVLALLGVGTLIAENVVFYQALRWGGMFYLLWLAYDSWREAQDPPEDGDITSHLRVFFQRGLITNLLNPKAALFYITVLPSFVATPDQYVSEALVLTAIYVFAATLIHSLLVVGAGSLTPLFARAELRKRAGLVFGLLLVAVAIWLFIKTA